MSDDLIGRLRQYALGSSGSILKRSDAMLDAAATIERLTRERDRLREEAAAQLVRATQLEIERDEVNRQWLAFAEKQHAETKRLYAEIGDLERKAAEARAAAIEEAAKVAEGMFPARAENPAHQQAQVTAHYSGDQIAKAIRALAAAPEAEERNGD